MMVLTGVGNFVLTPTIVAISYPIPLFVVGCHNLAQPFHGETVIGNQPSRLPRVSHVVRRHKTCHIGEGRRVFFAKMDEMTAQ